MCDKSTARKYGRDKRVLAKICGYADAAVDPIDFPMAPAKAIPIALDQAGTERDSGAVWEINEAFAAVVLANKQVCPSFLPSLPLSISNKAAIDRFSTLKPTRSISLAVPLLSVTLLAIRDRESSLLWSISSKWANMAALQCVKVEVLHGDCGTEGRCKWHMRIIDDWKS